MFLSKILDLPIIDISSGRNVSKVVGWLLQADSPQLLCLLTKPKAWYENAAFLPFGAITGIGPQSVMINSVDAISPLHVRSDIPKDFADCPMGLGSSVYTPSGDFLGEIMDINIDDRGRIKSLLLSGGQKVSSARILTMGSSFIVSATGPMIPLGADEDIRIPSSISNEITVRKVRP